MHSQTSLSPTGYDSPYNNIGQLEGSQTPDYYPQTQTPTSYQYPNTQGSVRRRIFIRPRDYERFPLLAPGSRSRCRLRR